MEKQLSPSAQKVQDILNKLGFHFEVIEANVHTRTAEQAAELAGCELGQIVKSLVFKTRETGQPILILTSGANRVNEELIGSFLGEKIQRADPDFVRAVTGFAIGGIPPIGHSQQIQSIIDEDLLKYQTIWAAAGTPNSLFELTPSALISMTKGNVKPVKG